MAAPLNIAGTARGRLRLILRNPGPFLVRVLRGMRRNQVFLLSGALAYNALLSIIPFFALILLALSHVMDQEGLLETLTGTVELVIPGQAGLVLHGVCYLLGLSLTNSVLGVLAALGFIWPGWWLWVVIALIMKPVHPRIWDEDVPLDPRRRIIGWITILIFILCFAVEPIRVSF